MESIGREMGYILEVREPGEADREIARVSLPPEEVWEQKVEFPVGAVGESKKKEFLLFKEDETEPYRSLRVHVDIRNRQ